MKRQAYKSKSGRTLYKPVCSIRTLYRLNDENSGWCLGCGTQAYGVEPDARRYQCESCDEKLVYGFQELTLMNLIEIPEEVA